MKCISDWSEVKCTNVKAEDVELMKWYLFKHKLIVKKKTSKLVLETLKIKQQNLLNYCLLVSLTEQEGIRKGITTNFATENFLVCFNKNIIPTNAQFPVYLAQTCLHVSALCGHHQGTIQLEYQYL